MNSKTAVPASAWLLTRRRASSSHSSVAKTLSAHGVVVGISDRAHRGHARLPAALPELDGGVLRTLVGVMDHAVRTSPYEAACAARICESSTASACARRDGTRFVHA